MDNTESKELLDMDDFEMDELLTEFAEEENKTNVIELSDSEDELGKLVEEFATTLSDSDDDEKKTGAKVILSSSDDEIDNLLDGFNEEDSSESDPVEVKQEMDLNQIKHEGLSEKDIDCGTYDENKKSIIIIDSNTQNDTFYDSAVEILVSDENPGTPVKASLDSNLCKFKTNESRPAFSLSAININNYSQNQEHEKHSQDIPSKTNSADYSQNCSKENKNTFIQQSNENFVRNSQNKNFKDKFSSVPCNVSDDISHTNNSSVPVKTLPTNENLDSLVNSVIGLNNLKQNPSPLSITNVTILCDENVLKPKNENTKDVTMTKIIEHAIDECMRHNLKTSSIKTIEQEFPNFNTNTESPEFQENSSEMLPVIENVTGSECNIQTKLENSISNCDSAQQKNCKSISEDEANSTSEDSAKIKSNTLANLSIKSENTVKPSDSKSCVKNLLDNFPGGVKMEGCFPTEKKIFHLSQDIVKSENCLPSEKNNCSFSKSIMAENMIYQEQPNIPKIAVEIKIHISSEENTKICKVLNESLLHPSEKTEHTNSKTADVSIKLNGLADNFLIPITNVTDKQEALFQSNSKIDSSHTFEFNQPKDRDLDGTSDNTTKLPLCEFKKRKLETSDSEISTKKLKQEPCNSSSIHKPRACDITSFILTEINEALPSDLNKEIRVSKKGLDYLVLQAFQKTFHVNFPQELSEAEKLIKELEKKSENLSKTYDLLLPSFREYRSIQKEFYATNSYKKMSNRTVGINVKIINTKDQETVTIPTNAASKKNKIIRKENEVSVIKENKGTSSLQQNVSVIKENKGTSSLQQNVVPVSSQGVPVEEKRVIELPKTSSPNVSQMEQKACPITSRKFSPPNVIQSGNRLIPYLNPTKRVSAPIVHVTNVLPGSKPVTNVVPSCNPAMNSILEKTKQTQHTERSPSPIKPGTSIQSSRTPVNNVLSSNPIMRSLLDLSEQPRYNESTQKGNSRTSTSPQNQQPKISESAAVPLSQPFQLCPSVRSEAPKVSVVFPFRSTASTVAPTVTINKDSYGIPQNHPVMRNIPSVSEALRNQIIRLPTVYSDAKMSSPVFSKLMMQNKGQYPAGYPRFSQSNFSQGPMASVNSSPFPLYHPATTASNPMQQSNMQLSSMHHLSNSPFNHPLTSMNHLSPSMRHPPLSLPPSVASVNPSPSALTSPAFYPGAPTSMKQFAPNQFYPQTSINHFTSSPHASAQLRQMVARNVPVTAVANPSAPSSRVFPPPSAMPSKWTPLQPPVQSRLITPPSTPPVNHCASSKHQIPLLPETPSYDEPLPKPTLKVTKEETDVILSWNVDLSTSTVTLSSYQIYSCQTSSQLEVSPAWKKVGDVAALQLPMACRLRKFEKHKSYHFILRVVDNLQRLGPFSDCASVDI